MKLYYLFLLVMFFLFNSCVEQTPRTKSVAPISVRDTTKRTSRSHLWNSNTSTYKKTKSSYTPSKKTYKRKSSYKSFTGVLKVNNDGGYTIQDEGVYLKGELLGDPLDFLNVEQPKSYFY